MCGSGWHGTVVVGTLWVHCVCGVTGMVRPGPHGAGRWWPSRGQVCGTSTGISSMARSGGTHAVADPMRDYFSIYSSPSD